MHFFLIVSVLTLLSACGGPAAKLQKDLDRRSGLVELPAGVLELGRELVIPQGTNGLEVVGAQGSVLRPGKDFQGRGLIVCDGCRNVKFRNFAIEGLREEAERVVEMPPSEAPFSTHFQRNGILVLEADGISISNVQFREMPSLAVLVNHSKNVKIENVVVSDSGSRNAKGRNNTSGGILFEEGTDRFEVRGSRFLKIYGNGVWTHSRFHSPRNTNGVIEGNHFEVIGRDAIQVGHANRVKVLNNTGKSIGYPVGAVDVEGGGTPVGVDTAGKVDEAIYHGNRFEEINGKCFDLDGFHDGQVTGNTCINRGKADDYPNGHFALVMNNTFPEMRSQLITIQDNVFDGTKFGGIFVIGAGHKIINNKLRNLNKAHCNEEKARFICEAFPGEPDLMQAGIYLGQRAERPDPAVESVIEGNEIHGFRMKTRCILAAPKSGLALNSVRNNVCLDAE